VPKVPSQGSLFLTENRSQILKHRSEARRVRQELLDDAIRETADLSLERDTVAIRLIKSTGTAIGIFIATRSLFDSEIFGRDTPLDVSKHLFRNATEALLRKGARLNIVRVTLNDVASLHAFLRPGVLFGDILVTLRRSCGISLVQGKRTNELSIDIAREADRAQVASIAKVEFRASHYHADAKLPRSKCSAIYVRWATSELTSADKFFVAHLRGKVVGFVSCIVRRVGPYAIGRIGLICVRKDYANKGIGYDLLETATSWLSKRCSSIYAGTQVNNVAAVAIYENAGFRIAESEMTLHEWLTPR